ncbi:hypothetical protein VTJ83DRAFT_2417 [Remersonia thermophila]|uniref:Uncharacterized protein n=1 Tax=Remersonia thermophila TaxID=72144 RepID=A0ABR4DIP2_9PEZI
MCIKEFLAYQCGHRSVMVVRPCPMTTTGHNYPVCTGAPERTFYAETMCAACERQLHSRWVLIREWEHRWLHERGACGCDVIFPGLLNQPRVIGDTAASDAADSPQPGSEVSEEPSKSPALAESKNSRASKLKAVDSKDASNGASSKKPAIPALFTEEVTEKGEHHVAVRLPGLYAAEWQADHAALHKSGQCSCAADAGPFKPSISIKDMTPTERDNLRRWHQLEEAHSKEPKGKEAGNGNAAEEKIDETRRHIDEIAREFGKFTTESAPSKRGRDSGSLDDKTQRSRSTRSNDSSESKSYIGSDVSTPHGRRIAALAQQRRQHYRMGPYAGRTAPLASPHGPHGKGIVPHLVLESQPTAPYHPYTFNPFQTAAASPSTAALPPHLQPHYFSPAYPRFATAATFTDTVPHGAYPWATEIIQGHNEHAHGPGPFTSAGLAYPTMPTMAFLGPSMNTPFHAFDVALATATTGNSSYNAGSQAAYLHLGQAQHPPGLAHNGRQPPTRPRAARHPRHPTRPATPAGSSSTTDAAGHAPRHPAGTFGLSDEDSTSGRGPDAAAFASASTFGSDSCAGPRDVSICGLPVGAGPEGTLHMPSWMECRLRKTRSASESAVTMLEDEEHGEEEDGCADGDFVPSHEQPHEEVVETWMGGAEEGGRRPALQRRYSAET